MKYKDLLKIAINATIKGGNAIMKVYSSDFDVEYKEDQSPLTLADRNCNKVIEQFLIKTDIPILSEEGSSIPFLDRKNL